MCLSIDCFLRFKFKTIIFIILHIFLHGKCYGKWLFATSISQKRVHQYSTINRTVLERSEPFYDEFMIWWRTPGHIWNNLACCRNSIELLHLVSGLDFYYKQTSLQHHMVKFIHESTVCSSQMWWMVSYNEKSDLQCKANTHSACCQLWVRL